MSLILPTMSWVTSAICSREALHLAPSLSMVRLHVVGLLEHVGHRVLLVLLVHLLRGALHADLERDRGVLDRLALAAG